MAINYSQDLLFEAEYRYARHFLNHLQMIGDIYNEWNERTEVALARLDEDWGQIQNAYNWALKNLHDNRAAEMCSQFPLVGGFVLVHRQNIYEYHNWLHNGIKAARQINDQHTTAVLLNDLSMAYLHQQDAQSALPIAHEALQTIEETAPNDNLIGAILNTLCIAYYSIGDYRRSLEFLEESLKFVEAEGDESKLMKALGNLGILRSRLGDYDEAIRIYNRTLQIARKRQSKLDIATDLCNLGVAYNDLDEYEKALAYHQEALAIARQLDDRWRTGLYLFNVALSYSLMHNYDQALIIIEQYYQHGLKNGQVDVESAKLQFVSVIYAQQGDIEKGLEAIHRSQALNEHGEFGELNQTFAKIYHLAQRYDLAISYYDQAISAYLEDGWKIGLARAYEELSTVYMDVNDVNSAAEFRQKALQTYQEMGHQRGIARLSN